MEPFDINRIVPKAYAHLDEYTDNFAKTDHIASDLLLGTLPDEPPFLSVLIPTYWRTELLRQAVESVLAQREVPFAWEIVVVDNTPLDASGTTPALTVLRDFDAPNLRYYHNRENIGSGYNWNRAVELAQGEWACFLHDDDLLFPDALQTLSRILYRDEWKKPLGYIQARRVEFVPPAVPEQNRCLSYLLPLTRRSTLITGYTGTENPSCGTTILRRAYFETGGINYDFGPSADAVLGYQIMRSYTVVMSDACLGAYRWQENESLRAETIKNLIYADELFARYRYGLSKCAALWGKLFSAAQKERNIRLKMRISARSGNVLKRGRFEKISGFATMVQTVCYIPILVLYRYMRHLCMKCRYKNKRSVRKSD